jgi:hypothetical protein
MTMADSRDRGPEDGRYVNVHQDYEVRYWTERFGVTAERLKAAVEKVGTYVPSVEQELAAGDQETDGAAHDR